MPLQIDQPNKQILITSPDTTVDAQELHDFIEDWMATPIGMANDGLDPEFLGDILKPEGKIQDPTNPTQFTLIVLRLNPEWQFRFWVGSGNTKVTGGKIIGGVGDNPFAPTQPGNDITVVNTPVDGTTTVVTTGGSALTPEQDQKLTDIYNELNVVEGSMSHKDMMKMFMAALCGRTRDADTLGPITENTTRIDFLGMDGAVRMTSTVMGLFGTRTAVSWHPDA